MKDTIHNLSGYLTENQNKLIEEVKVARGKQRFEENNCWFSHLVSHFKLHISVQLIL